MACGWTVLDIRLERTTTCAAPVVVVFAYLVAASKDCSLRCMMWRSLSFVAPAEFAAGAPRRPQATS